MMENTKKNTALEAVVIGLKLLLICAVIAAIVSFVYTVFHYGIDCRISNRLAYKAFLAENTSNGFIFGLLQISNAVKQYKQVNYQW